jgi:hypothetical protein
MNMTPSSRWALPLVLAALLATPLGCSSTQTTGTSPDDASATGERDVDAQASRWLRLMSNTLRHADALRFRAVTIEDVVDPDTGEVSHDVTARTVSLARPGRLRVGEGDALTRHEAWFVDGRLTVLDAPAGLFAVTDAPETVPDMLDHLFAEYGLVLPIGDLLYDDPYDVLSADVETGRHLGVAQVSGHACHHLAFRQPTLDWQVWIEAASHVPRRIVLSYKDEPGHPQFTATLSEWDLSPTFAPSHFEASLPADAVEVSLEELTSDAAMTAGDGDPALLAVVSLGMLPDAEVRLAEHAGAPRRAATARRGGGRRGAVRSGGRGSVRHHSGSRSSRARSSRSTRSRGSVNRSTGRRSTAGRSTRSTSSRSRGNASRSNIRRTPHSGSLRGHSHANRSVASRSRAHARPLPARHPHGRRALARDRHHRFHANRRAYVWANRRYYWWAGYWYAPYYYGDDTDYVVTYPPAGLEVDDLDTDGAEVVSDDGSLIRINGVYYQRQADGSYVVVEAPPSADPDPVTLVNQMCNWIRQQESFSFTASDSMDNVQDSGQKLQTQSTRSFQVQRPGALAATQTGEELDKVVWYDGRSVTLLDRHDGIYAKTDAPGTIDEMLDFMIEEVNVSLPLIDLLFADPYAIIADATQQGQYLGETEVNGVDCHHLSFSSPDVDWEVWIDAGADPVPQMLAITYTGAPESPTYTATFTSWDADASFDASTFAASIPSGTEEIPFVTPQSEIERIKDEIDRHRDENRRVAEYIASQKVIKLYSTIADKPEAAERIEEEKAKLEKLGDVPQEEIDAYNERNDELQEELREARRAARR